MAGDYTRFRYNSLKDTTAVLMQQGRVLLDQDWNEYVQLQDRRWHSETMDIMGRAVVPSDTPNAFEIQMAGTSFTIGIGRMYVEGLQPENHGIDPEDPAKRKYDPILGELIGTSPVPYEKQPYLPTPPSLPADTNPHLVYLDVWERELTYLEDPSLIDQAVAVDTGTRLQTVWQVKILADSAGFTCSTDPFAVPALAPSAGRLTTAAAGVPASTDPCIVPANGGYRGSGNRCYRIEIHTGGPMATAQFKWSRDNASVATAVTGINAGLDTLTVVLTKRDSVLRFQPDDWAEVTDDFRYFAGLPGEMRQVAVVDDVNLTIQLKTALPAGEFDATNLKRHTRVIRWDQKGIVRDPLGNVIVDVDTNGGLIPVPAAGTTIVLEDGIQITFSIDSSMPVGNFHPLDYWIFDARVVDASIEILTEAPPRGVLHHYAWLANVTFPSGPASNCRLFWPPSQGQSCDCTVCVTADSHNSGKLTLQSAVNQVTGAGGKICVGPGLYVITSPVTITSASNIEISGHGLPSLVASGLTVQQSILQIDSCADINIDDLAFVGPAVGPNQQPVTGVAISNSLFTRITRCAFTGFSAPAGTPGGGQSTMFVGVALSSLIWDGQIQDCLFSNVQVGIGASTAEGAQTPFVAFSSFHNNEINCTVAGFQFANPKLVAQFLEVSFVNNAVAGPIGFNFGGQGLDITVERNSFALTASTTQVAITANAAIICAGSQVSIKNNEVGGVLPTPGQDAIVLDGNVMYGTQVTGNRIDALAGNGIVIKEGTTLQQTIFSQNQILTLGGSGILAESGSFAVDLNITGNTMAFVALNATTTNGGGGVLLLGTVFNVNASDNVIEAVGPTTPNIGVAGLAVMVGANVRIAGNRAVDIDPTNQAQTGFGILALTILGRLDIVDNEVRRASVPPASASTAAWRALGIGTTVGAVNIRGNVLESFGSTPTVVVLTAPSCIFTDNQCFLDNVVTAGVPTPVLAVQLGDGSARGAIVASNNFVQTPVVQVLGGPGQVVMSLNPKDKDKTLTVLGNITSGAIDVGGVILQPPWAPLNVRTI